jgi:hypothetical protein
LKSDPKTWQEVAERIMAWEYRHADGSTIESIAIGLWASREFPVCATVIQELKRRFPKQMEPF